MLNSGKFASLREERMERAKSRSVMILTPVARDPVVEYTASLASTLMTLNQLGIKCGFQFVIGGSIVHRARNELLAHFMASDFTDCLFIDDDMEWSPNDVVRLLASDKPVIGGVGRKRARNRTPIRASGAAARCRMTARFIRMTWAPSRSRASVQRSF